MLINLEFLSRIYSTDYCHFSLSSVITKVMNSVQRLDLVAQKTYRAKDSTLCNSKYLEDCPLHRFSYLVIINKNHIEVAVKKIITHRTGNLPSNLIIWFAATRFDSLYATFLKQVNNSVIRSAGNYRFEGVRNYLLFSMPVPDNKRNLAKTEESR